MTTDIDTIMEKMSKEEAREAVLKALEHINGKLLNYATQPEALYTESYMDKYALLAQLQLSYYKLLESIESHDW